MQDLGFKIYLVFVFSWFLHLAGRIPLLGLIRLDLALVVLLFVIKFVLNRTGAEQESPVSSDKDLVPAQSNSGVSKALNIFMVFAIAAIPFSEWPGTVFKAGIPDFLRAVVFYFFTIWFVNTERQLKIFIGVLLFTQVVRVLEPLYLHLTQGYWGSMASMSGWEFMYRLSGGPHDVINPNGLAFIIVSTIPFLHYFSAGSFRYRIVYFSVLAAFLYALILTGSRSGLVALLVVLIGFILKSSRKGFLIALICAGVAGSLPLLNEQQRDRFISLVDSSAKNAATASDRTEGIWHDLEIVLRKPFVGHGLGTSTEVNANYGKRDLRSHNLYTEVAQELGLIGLIIFVYFLKTVITSLNEVIRIARSTGTSSKFVSALLNSMHVLVPMNIIFSFASYGLLKHDWYLLAGLTVTVSHMQDYRQK